MNMQKQLIAVAKQAALEITKYEMRAAWLEGRMRFYLEVARGTWICNVNLADHIADDLNRVESDRAETPNDQGQTPQWPRSPNAMPNENQNRSQEPPANKKASGDRSAPTCSAGRVTAYLTRLPIGEAIRETDFWNAPWGWERITHLPRKWWGGRQTVTKQHVKIYRVTGLAESLPNDTISHTPKND